MITFLVIMAPKQQKVARQLSCRMEPTCILVYIPKGTIHKCDKNNFLKTGASVNTYKLDILF